METTSKDGVSEPSKGQLVFVTRVVYEDEETMVAVENEPVIFDHKEELDVGGGEYDRWWFTNAKGELDYVQGPKGFVEPPRTAEEVFGFRPSL